MADGSSKQPRLSSRAEVADWLVEAASDRHIEGPNGEVVFWVRMGPDVAGAILRALNGENPRNEMHSVAARYIRDMADGNWMASYATLVFEGDDFNCIDGQHRLRGVVQSGTSQWFLAVIYAAPEAKRAIDIGRTRSISATHGLDTKCAAACRVIYQLETGESKTATREQIATVASAYESVAAEVVLNARRRQPTAQGSFIAAFMIALKHSSEPQIVRELLEDISTLNQSSEAAKCIVQVLERDGAATGVYDRCDQALKILLGITSHLEGRPRQILRASVQGLRWFLPNSRYRISGPSPQLGGKRRASLPPPAEDT
jgi:hypothetical protein